MDLKRCHDGHLYDPGKHSSCPFCGVPGLNLQKTQPKQQAGEPHLFDGGGIPETRPKNNGAGARGDLEKTKGVLHDRLGLNPVVGWLVCVEGPDRGRDYRIRAERNFIGRSERMEISISGDNTISREKHACITYFPKNNSFKLSAGDATGIVYLNGADVEGSAELKPYDRIELGKTRLLFIPFCGEAFKWA